MSPVVLRVAQGDSKVPGSETAMQQKLIQSLRQRTWLIDRFELN